MVKRATAMEGKIMRRPGRLIPLTLSASLVAFVGCQPSEPEGANPLPPNVSGESPDDALESRTESDDVSADPGSEEPATASETAAPTVTLPESLPTIDQLPALSSESSVDERTKLHFTRLGEFEVRDGVYVFRLNASGGGTREIVMTLETQSNGFAVRRGDQTRLRFVTDEAGVAFASEPGSGEIAGRGVASGDDWIRGAYRTENGDGSSTEGTFELRKLFDPKTPRTTPSVPAQDAGPAKSSDPAVSEAVREG